MLASRRSVRQHGRIAAATGASEWYSYVVARASGAASRAWSPAARHDVRKSCAVLHVHRHASGPRKGGEKRRATHAAMRLCAVDAPAADACEERRALAGAPRCPRLFACGVAMRWTKRLRILPQRF